MTAPADVLALYRQAQIDKIDVREYSPPGPVAAAFMRDRVNKVRGLHGPIGSGKTSVNFFDKLTLAAEMPKCTRGPYAGHRVHRHIEVRDTYANLWSTTIKSWWSWYGPDIGNWTGGEGRKATHSLTFETADKSLIYFEVVFQAIQDQDVDAALRGVEFTTGNMGEADQQSADVLPYLIGRALQMRWPPKRFFDPGTDYYTGVTLDLNPADPENWVYDVFEDKRPAGHKLYKQPSGRGPNGENRISISRATYERMAEMNAHRPDWVRRMVDGLKGHSRDGEPVYPEYDDTIHCAEEDLEPLPGIPLRLCFDQGVRGPAMLVFQFTPDGQVRLLDEYCPGRIGPSGFGRGCRLLLETRYRGFKIERATGDPAGFFGGDSETGDKSMFEIVAEVMDIVIWPAESQELHVRQDGVRQLLRYSINPRRPGLLVSPRCKMLRKGFNSGYRYKKRRGQEAGTDPVPEKNEYSNPHDALQYGVLDLVGVEGVKRGELMGGRGDKPFAADEDDSPRGGSAMPKTDFDVWKS
ncbi:hypothetical protein MCHK_3013 [Mesorhizobium huakuii 7653R]|nr:hypothetical protein MCHK_3013 [Mesorhizobium huakuii 7653R]